MVFVLPRYDRRQSYDWNYAHAPDPVEAEVPPMPGDWTFCGRAVPSPLGIPAGPLLNGRWVLYYASLGFDVLTYKTVRRVERACYPLPNLQPVRAGSLEGGEGPLAAVDADSPSWAVSFGMPSKHPDDWRRDVEWTRSQLSSEKLLSVSVVGTVEPGWSIDELAADYAQCARWAVDSGADAVETNFSCPNVSTCDGQLYQQPEQAAIVAGAVREQIGDVPYLAKIGHVDGDALASELIEALGPLVDALAMTNSIATQVTSDAGDLLFNGEPRGICGDATREASVRQTRRMAKLVASHGHRTRLIGVGGVSEVKHVRQYLDAGAEAVHLATAAMLDPAVGLKIRQQWRPSLTSEIEPSEEDTTTARRS